MRASSGDALMIVGELERRLRDSAEFETFYRKLDHFVNTTAVASVPDDDEGCSCY